MTGRIFYWNKTTFEKAGLATPTTLEELMAAGPIFAEAGRTIRWRWALTTR